MPLIRSTASKRRTLLILIIILLSKIMFLYFYYTKKKLLYIIIAALFNRQPFFILNILNLIYAPPTIFNLCLILSIYSWRVFVFYKVSRVGYYYKT